MVIFLHIRNQISSLITWYLLPPPLQLPRVRDGSSAAARPLHPDAARIPLRRDGGGGGAPPPGRVIVGDDGQCGGSTLVVQAAVPEVAPHHAEIRAGTRESGP